MDHNFFYLYGMAPSARVFVAFNEHAVVFPEQLQGPVYNASLSRVSFNSPVMVLPEFLYNPLRSNGGILCNLGLSKSKSLLKLY